MANGKHKAIEKHSTELATIQSGNIMSTMPEYLRNMSGGTKVLGAENVEPDDLILPRLAVCSKNTPQYDESNKNYIDGLELGDFFNTVTLEIYGPEIYVVPLLEQKNRKKYEKYGSGLPPTCVSLDGKNGEGNPGGQCQLCKFKNFTPSTNGGKNTPPECTEIKNFAVVLLPKGAVCKGSEWVTIPRADTFSVLRFQRTSSEEGKKWLSLINFRNRDWFSGVYKIASFQLSESGNSWYIPTVKNADWLSQEGYAACRPGYELAKTMFAKVAAGTAKIDEDAEDMREPGAEG